MMKTTVKLIVLSSGSLVRPWAKTDWKTPRPRVRNSATNSVRAAAGHATEDAGRDRGRDDRGDEPRGDPADPDRERTGRARRAAPRRRRDADQRRPPPAATMNPSGSASARPVRFAPPNRLSAAPVGLRPRSTRREIAGRAEQQPDHGEDQGRGRDRRRPTIRYPRMRGSSAR